MGGFLSAPKMPAVQPAPLPPAKDPVNLAEQDSESLRAARAASSGGRASQILTSPLGVTGGDDAKSLSKYLLG